MPINLDFLKELTQLINRYSMERDSNTPDYILAEYLYQCLDSYNFAVNSRKNFFNNPTEEPVVTHTLVCSGKYEP